jgi:2-polyprenyl-3-methyl-5-hydroxy-6-metoxy-1,4-benzoquinol methylase
MTVCKICDNSINNRVFTAREMMFGFKDEFEYLECNACKSLQLIHIPENLDKYYPANAYYSFDGNTNIKELNTSAISYKIRRIQTNYLLYQRNQLLGSLLCLGYKEPDYIKWLQSTTKNFEANILDIGCGDGRLLFKLRDAGFNNLAGIDPFISNDIVTARVKIYKKAIDEITDRYDFIMLHHAFEHLDNPQETLKKLYALLNPQSYLLIRIPITNAQCWAEYGINWAPLDAPRHIFIHSEKSMQLMCHKAGFQLIKIEHDATAFHFWGSEQYKRGIAMMDPDSYHLNRGTALFSKEQIQSYNNQIAELNNKNLGGDAAFYLYKA